MRSKRSLWLVGLSIGLWHGAVGADVALVKSPPEPHVLVPEKVVVELFACPQRSNFDCPEQARPKGNPSRWFTIDVYPAQARRANQSGAIAMRLDVDRLSGRANSCTVTRSSGFENLDVETCAIFRRRAQFWPQTLAKGKKAPLTFSARVIWLPPWIE